MLKDIIEVRPLEDYNLFLRFEDGVAGEVNIASVIEFSGVFEALRDKAYFDQVAVNPEIGTIVWPNDTDLDPDVLYARVTGKPMPSYSIRVHTVTIED